MVYKRDQELIIGGFDAGSTAAFTLLCASRWIRDMGGEAFILFWEHPDIEGELESYRPEERAAFYRTISHLAADGYRPLTSLHLPKSAGSDNLMVFVNDAGSTSSVLFEIIGNYIVIGNLRVHIPTGEEAVLQEIASFLD
jgi:hypothetical protein